MEFWSRNECLILLQDSSNLINFLGREKCALHLLGVVGRGWKYMGSISHV